jgi:chemotaxis protein methyltransferase CheR
MKPPLDNTMLDDVSRCIAEQMGLYFPPSKWRSLEQALGTAAGELGLKDAKECVEWFVSSTPSKERIEALSSYLTIGETYFFRENRSFEILEQKIIPALLRSKVGHERRLRIWSAGCSTGEEPYTIAIMLHRMRDLLKGYDLSILATDINPHALRKAREGIYSEWSFRTTPSWFKERFFRPAGDKRYELLPRIRKMVTFS